MSNPDTLRAALAELVKIAADLVKCDPLRELHPLAEVTHIGHRQFGRAYDSACEELRLLAIRLKSIFDAIATPQPAALSAPAASAAGWQWVPVEPNGKMEEAGKAVGEFHRGSDANDVYRAMLAAAPQPAIAPAAPVAEAREGVAIYLVASGDVSEGGRELYERHAAAVGIGYNEYWDHWEATIGWMPLHNHAATQAPAAPAAPVWRRLTDDETEAIALTIPRDDWLREFTRAIESALARINGATLTDKA
jgi:hypothetical protein